MPRYYYEDPRWPWRPDPFLQKFLPKKRNTPGGRALDLGMGYGRNALWLAAHGYRVEGWETDRRYLAEARREARRRSLPLRARRGDFTRARFRGPYQVVVISNALHQARRSQALRVLARARRELAPGGRIFLLAKLARDSYFQRVTRHPAWRPVRGERATYRHRRRGWIFSALTPGEIKAAVRGLHLRRSREVVLRSAWDEPVTHRFAEVVAEKPRRP